MTNYRNTSKGLKFDRMQKKKALAKLNVLISKNKIGGQDDEEGL